MAVRIRKLAREVDRNPVELLGVLHALGFQKFRSADDMLSPDVEAKLRRALQKGVRPVELPESVVVRPDAVEAVAVSRVDVMAALVPGIVPAGRSAAPPASPTAPGARPAPRPTPATAAAAPVRSAPARVPSDLSPSEHEDPAVLSTERAALDSVRRALSSERAVLDAERSQLELESARVAARERSLAAQQEALRELQASLERERAGLDAERHALDDLRTRSAASASVGLEDLLEARGLRGMDEYERAIVALATQRVLRDVLWSFRVDAPDHLRRLLEDRVVLVAGQAPEAATRGAAIVAVAPERAEVPDAVTHDKRLARLGEQLLLRGWRRLLLIGGRPRWQRLLRHGLDARIEVRVAPAGPRTPDMAHEDVRWADVVVHWAAEVGAEAEAIYGAARPSLVKVEGTTWTAFLSAFHASLDETGR